ncbi:MAG: bifunctional nuclease family protein [Actinomycetia bacterium]|nr:bifunctional nuclease family protein [Actinomycetes bacterium]MCP4959855.1 bifunctional nuclease family protein [Actinomycetes bacterium]
MRVPVKVLGLHVVPSSGATVLLVGESDDPTRVLPIFIGQSEASSIAIALGGLDTPRPLTHDLFVEVMNVTGAGLKGVEVTELRDGTFFADIEIEVEGEVIVLSARPSDGIALAVRVGVPIYVDTEVLDEAAVAVEREAERPFDEEEIDEIVSSFQDFLETASAQDFAETAEGEEG